MMNSSERGVVVIRVLILPPLPASTSLPTDQMGETHGSTRKPHGNRQLGNTCSPRGSGLESRRVGGGEGWEKIGMLNCNRETPETSLSNCDLGGWFKGDDGQLFSTAVTVTRK